MVSNKRAVIQTLLYSSLFSSALTFEDLHYFLQSETPVTSGVLQQALGSLKKSVIHKGALYALKDHEQDINESRDRRAISQKKLYEALKMVPYLSLLPTVLFIGVSGSVAAKNATVDDDVDLFVITTHNSLYITRLFLLLVLELFGKRRKRNEVQAANKICLNMLITESSLPFPKPYHDLYTAREIAQVYPLFERGDMYRQFLLANSWTETILPHALGRNQNFVHRKREAYQAFTLFEPFFRHLEQYFMKRHRTQERIEKDVLALHPHDVRKNILQDYQQELVAARKYYK